MLNNLRITSLNTNPSTYSSNSYLIRGKFNSMSSVNTLVDTGSDRYIIDEIRNINTGFGKKPVEQIVLTHKHFDHTGGVKDLKKEFGSIVYSYSADETIDKLLIDNQIIQMGDYDFRVIYTPGHTNDSVCLYNENYGVLFTGDTNIDIKTTGGSYSYEFLETIKKLSELDVNIIYPGHGAPLSSNPNKTIKRTLNVLKQCNISV